MVLWVSGGANRPVGNLIMLPACLIVLLFFCASGEDIIWLSDYPVYHLP